MNKRLPVIIALFLIALGGMLLAWQAFAPPAVLAEVDNQPITQEMVTREINLKRLNLQGTLPPLSAEARQQMAQQVLHDLITRQLVLRAATEQGFTLDEAAVAERVDLVLHGYQSQGLTTGATVDSAAFEAQVEQALAAHNLTHADLVDWVRQLYTMERFVDEEIAPQALGYDARQAQLEAWVVEQRRSVPVTVFE